MDFPVKIIMKMVEALAQKTGEDMNYQGFENMAEKVNEVMGKGTASQKYLYENMYRSADKAIKKKQKKIGLSPQKVRSLAKYLGFDSFEEFRKDAERPISRVLKSCEGTWSSYVRMNSPESIVLKSPVKLKVVKNEMHMYLRGKVNEFKGKVELREGCLFATLAAENGKSFHHIYKIGLRINPSVLQGIFAAVSSSFDPIGGRVVLIREEVDFNELENEEIDLQKDGNKSNVLKKLKTYFKKYSDNNLKTKSSITFGLGDLGR